MFIWIVVVNLPKLTMENIDKKCFTQTTNVINKKTAIKLGVSLNN